MVQYQESFLMILRGPAKAIDLISIRTKTQSFRIKDTIDSND